MTEKFIQSIHNKGNVFGALLADLLKAFHCIDHTLLIVKLFTFGVSHLSLKFIYSYLSNRTQRVKINELKTLVIELMLSLVSGFYFRTTFIQYRFD